MGIIDKHDLLIGEATIKREYGNLPAVPDNFEKYVVSMDDMPFTNYEGIRHIRPWELPGVLAGSCAFAGV